MAQLLRLPQVQQRVPLSRSRIYELIAANEFPRPISLGARAVAWDAQLIDEWVQQRINASRKEVR